MARRGQGMDQIMGVENDQRYKSNEVRPPSPFKKSILTSHSLSKLNSNLKENKPYNSQM